MLVKRRDMSSELGSEDLASDQDIESSTTDTSNTIDDDTEGTGSTTSRQDSF